MKVTIDGKVHEIEPSDLELGENEVIVDKTNPPSGLFTQEALDEKIKQRLAKEPDKIKGNLKEDKDFHQQILSQYNISLDESGQPKGLKPDFDPEEWKRSKVKELTEPYESKLSEKEKQISSFKRGLVNSQLMKDGSRYLDDPYLKSFSGEDDPYVVTKFSPLFDADDDGRVYQVDKEGGWKIDNKGERITPDKYFEIHSNDLEGIMKDNRQKGSGFQNGSSSGGTSFTREQLANMSEAEYEANREAIQEAQQSGKIK